MANNYTPRQFGEFSDVGELARAVAAEFQFLARQLQELEYLQLRELNAAPTRPREGMIVLADGTNWNPGSGAGFYGYYGGAWNKLG